jgi:hypothetical protein
MPPWRRSPDQLGRYSFGRDVQGLCVGCTKMRTQSIFLGCPLLLHLWSYEWLPVSQPSIDRSSYPALEEGQPSRQADHGVDVVPPPSTYFELTLFVSYLKVMHIVELTHSLICSSLGQRRPGGRTWTSSARLTTSRTTRLSGSHSPMPWLPCVHCRVCHPCAFRTVTSG